MNKKAQITWFIIAGAVILIAGIVTLVMLQQVTQTERPEETERAALEASPISRYVQDCIENSMSEGLAIISLQGGYITLPEGVPTLDVRNENGYTVVEEDGRKRVVQGDGINKVPYWVTDVLTFPTIEYIILDYETYIESETIACIDDFNSFREQGYDISYDFPIATVTFGEKTIVDVNFSIKAEKPDEVLEFEKFTASAPVNFKLAYDSAFDIALSEFFTAFLEDSTNNLISLYSGVDSQKLPPTAATTSNTDCDYETWNDNYAKNILRNVLAGGISNVKIKGTDFAEPSPGIMESFVFDTGFAETTGLVADFEYLPEWDMLKYDIKPRQGPGIAAPDKVRVRGVPFLPQICTFEYNYKYDVEYPILLTVTDMNSDDIDPLSNIYTGKGYSLIVPLQVILCGNKERRCTGAPAYLGRVELNQSFADESGYVETLFCNEEQKLSKELSINVGVEGARIDYSCGEENNNNCFMGETNSDGMLVSKFPLCYNGIISISKTGYGEFEDVLTTLDIEETSIDYTLDPIREFESEFAVITAIDFINAFKSGDVEAVGDYLSGLSPDESAIMSLEGSVDAARAYPLLQEEKIGLAAGDYFMDYIVRAPIKVLPSFPVEGVRLGFSNTSDIYEGVWITGSGSIAFELSADELEGKTKVIFIGIVTRRANDFASAAEFQDPIFNIDGDIEVELLYQNEILIDVSGMNSRDFVADDPGERVEYMTITRGEYSRFLKPLIG